MMTPTAALGEPGRRSLGERADALFPLIVAQAPLSEASGFLTPEIIEAVKGSGLFHFWLPRCFGGEETPPVDALRAIESLCYADGSTGWVVMASAAAVGSAGAYLPISAARRLFEDARPIIAGQGAPNGKAIVEAGGFRLSGRWSYGSGALHAQYIHTGAMIADGGTPPIAGGGGAHATCICILPADQVTFLGNWDVLGLRATGSVDYAISDVHVPSEFTHGFMATVPNQGGDLYRIGILGMTGIGHVGFALGVARRALDELLAVVGADGPQPTLWGQPSGFENLVQHYASAEANLRSVRAFAYDVWADIQRTVEQGRAMEVRQLTLARLIVNHATTVATNIATFALRYGGGKATRNSPIQRCFRDMQTGAQHITTSPLILAECGRELMGFGKGKVWGFRGLVNP
jgi:alkylation response protein AidB-like acyl-CoA dehydrogenase